MANALKGSLYSLFKAKRKYHSGNGFVVMPKSQVTFLFSAFSKLFVI